MADQIIIELIGDPSGLKPAEDALKELSKISQDNLETFNKANESLKKFQESLGEASKKAAEAAESGKKLGESIKGISEKAEGIKKVSNAYEGIGTAAGKSITALSSLNGVIAAGAIKEMSADVKKAAKDTQDWGVKVAEFTKTKEELNEKLEKNRAAMAASKSAGDTASVAYETLLSISRSLGGQISSNNQKLEKAIEAHKNQGKAATEAGDAAEKSGEKQDEHTKKTEGATTATSGLMSKLNALATAHKDTAKNTSDLLGHTHTLTTAMGEVGEAIARASGDEDAAAEIKKKTALAIQAISTAQSVATVATEAGTVATTIFGTAAAAAWAAATLGVGALIGGVIALIANFKEVTSWLGRIFNIGEAAETNKKLQEQVKTSRQHTEALKDQLDKMQEQGKELDVIAIKKKALLEAEKKALEDEISLAKNNNDSAKAQELKNKLHEKTIELIHLETEAQNAENEAKKKAADDAKAAYEKKLSDAKALADTRLSITKTGSKAELDARISDLNAAAAIEINTAKGNAEMIKAIRLKRDQDIASAQAQYRARQLEDEKTGIEAELVLAQKGSQQEYDLRMKILAKERELVAADTTLTANQKLKAFNEINQKEDELYQHLQEHSAAAAQQGQDAEAKRLSTHDTTNQALVKSDQGTAAQVEKLDDQTTDHKKKNAEKLKEMEKKAASEAIKLGKEVADAIFAAQAEKRKAALDDTINKLEAQKNSELSNSHLTAAQKKTIEEKYRREEAAAKLKAWKADQQAKAEQAIINGLLAFTTSMAQQGYPAGLVTGLLAIAQAGVTVGTILSKAPPKFAKGVISLDGPGTETSDSIAAYLSRGESVITAERTKQYKPVLEQIQAGIYQPLPIPMLSTFPRLHDLSAYTPLSLGEGSGLGIDYDKLGRAVAQALPKSKVQKLSFDRKGFSHYLLSESGQVQSYNNRYKE